MNIDPESVWSDIQTLKKISPLIHNITNYVVMESTANALLAMGASPVMAHAVEEVEDMVSIAQCLVLNIGTLSPVWVQAMLCALKAANSRKIPVVFDPVGVGASSYRKTTSQSILNHGQVTAIRGNASEIATFIDSQYKSKGVDSLLDAGNFCDIAKSVAKKNHCVVWMSGKTDAISDGTLIFLVHNGDPLMSRVTGMGCIATAITGAFLAINQNSLQACVHAAITMGISGELAASKSQGPGSFKFEFIDALYNLSLDSIKNHIRCGAL